MSSSRMSRYLVGGDDAAAAAAATADPPSVSLSTSVSMPRIHPSPGPTPHTSCPPSPESSGMVLVATPSHGPARPRAATPSDSQRPNFLATTEEATRLQAQQAARRRTHEGVLTALNSASSHVVDSAPRTVSSIARPTPVALVSPSVISISSSAPPPHHTKAAGGTHSHSPSPVIRPRSAIPSSPALNSRPPPSSSPAPITAAFPTLPWVSHSNRELIRTAFSKRLHAHRGLLEPRFPVPDAGPALQKRHASTPSLSSNPLLLHAQLATATSATFHISVFGSAATGKTSTLHNLTGRVIPPKHLETSGMHLLDLCWPYKAAGSGEVYGCEMMFWDAGATASAQYKYIQQTPEQHADCCLYIVSCTDHASFAAAQRKAEDDANKTAAKIMILTKIDDRTRREVSDADLLSFQEQYNSRLAPQPTVRSPSAASTASPAPASPVIGALVVLKLANWPITNEPFFTRPGVASTLNTIAAMCIAHAQTKVEERK